METIDYLINYLLKENPQIRINNNPNTFEDKFRIYRSLVNIREAKPISTEYIEKEKELLGYIREKKPKTNQEDIIKLNKSYPNNHENNDNIISLWQGDITTLSVEAIVNAANSRGLGCFSPCHNCIDNQINTYAGVSLRLECNEAMKKYNYNLPTGEAFITKAYNLPSTHVIHTVGPIIQDNVTKEHETLLANCYINSLELARKNNIRSIAFPCISTGVFRFPGELASKIAIKAVDNYLDKYDGSFDNIIFNLYTNKDVEIYERTI
ncbi:protein-ADP-ribose hydrolase [Methanosphaera sp.]